MTNTTIRPLQEHDAQQLATMICTDTNLRKDLAIPADNYPDTDDFMQKVKTFCLERNADTFAILADKIAIGTISLSHQNLEARTAGIGYWIGTAHRQQGHCKRAFKAVLDYAREKGFTSVSATVHVNNQPSRQIWEQNQAARTPISSEKLRYELKTKSPNYTVM